MTVGSRRDRGSDWTPPANGGRTVTPAVEHLVVADRHGRPVRVTVARSGRRFDAPAAIRGVRPADPTEQAAASSAIRPDPLAWPPASADRAAHRREVELHRTVRRVVTVEPIEGIGRRPSGDGPDDGVDLPSAIEAAGSALRPRGVRRLDLRLDPRDAALAAPSPPMWCLGRVSDAVVASHVVAYPWSQPVDGDPPLPALARADRIPRWVPTRARRALRRTLLAHPAQVPDLARTAGAEAIAAARTRVVYGGAHRAPSSAAPDDAHPFAVTRYRVIHAALGLVPDALRSSTFVDIGAGDGRVLDEAARAGFAHPLGREIDPDLAAQARRRVGGRAVVEEADALEADLPDDAGVVFLNNPFGADTVSALADRIGASLTRRSRPMLVIYINPPTVRPLLDTGLLVVHAEPRFTVLASAEIRR